MPAAHVSFAVQEGAAGGIIDANGLYSAPNATGIFHVSAFAGGASASAGIELQHNVVLVIGMSAAATGPFVVAHDVMRDAIDAGAVRRALERTGAAPEDVVNVFAKAEASPDGRVRGWRHTMLNDSDIHSTRHARAAVGGVIASVVGRTAIYVSGGAEHQGPPGGGPVAVVARCRDTA